jgi:hypothetical protein
MRGSLPPKAKGSRGERAKAEKKQATRKQQQATGEKKENKHQQTRKQRQASKRRNQPSNEAVGQSAGPESGDSTIVVVAAASSGRCTCNEVLTIYGLCVQIHLFESVTLAHTTTST